jgi:hypothetical protein
MNAILKTVPPQYKGAASNTSYSVRAKSLEKAGHIFEKAKQNLINVNDWQKIAGAATAGFQVVSKEGIEKNGPPSEGDYLRITLPVVPGSTTGKGYDWVQVEQIEESDVPLQRSIAMRVRPAVPPFYDKDEVAHFFTSDATSTFCVQQLGRRIKASVYGRNEKPNTEVHNLFNKIRNMVIAVGAMIGFNKPQWKSLVKGILSH